MSIVNESHNGIVAFNIAGPKLTVVLSGSNVIISWSTDSPGLQLQSTTSLSSPSWSDVTNPVSTVNSRYTVTDSITGVAKFYRLH